MSDLKQSAPAGATAWAYHVTGKYRNEQGICTKESDINKTQALYLALGCHVEITPLYAAPQPAQQGEEVRRKLVERIQAAISTVIVPVTMAPSRAEYYKAGARHIIAKVNEALSASAEGKA